MPKYALLLAALALALWAAPAGSAAARDEIRIVGSSTVFPFSTAVAEEFGQVTDYRTPVVESTGSGGGLKLFCAGIGVAHPDIANSSRRIKPSEVANCAKNGVREIIEVKIGYDGIVLAGSKAVPAARLSLRQIWLALAKQVPVDGKMIANPNLLWADIDPKLAAERIEILGPPPTSGTRDAFVELAMEGGCKTFAEIAALKKSDKAAFKSLCHAIREDGAYVEAGENDNLIVQKLRTNPRALGIFGFSFLEQNRDVIHGSAIDGVTPEFDSISDGSYAVSRSMYFYVKSAHVGVIPGIVEFIDIFLDEDVSGSYGYLTDKGLIPLGDEEREAVRDAALSLKPLILPQN
ncbi:MAG: substrate-binding domain-containing protein [Alphaproteobacteria bacterium]|jgi:phosphate transport system substrate-binding protein|nr:substrate-binding domain-containing protein [Alphaproteobacteria bacterium]MDP6590800.1 substrate-binding domain-containing protein [Alphaproteobacteria bacterium]MDP6818834.1 substrate-binding domain-containing protein [Alphaproteobacteria bacterium]